MSINPCGMHPMFALDVPAPFPAPHATEALPARNISPTTFKTSRPPVLGRRRSVRSMKNLLPLTLPSSSSNSSNASSSNCSSSSRSSSSSSSIFSPQPIICRPVSSPLPTQFQPHHHHHSHHTRSQPHTDLSYGYQPERLCIRAGVMVEAAEPTMDCNLPELLAQDLEFSALIFAAKNMTAGAPSPALASDEDDWHDTAEPPSVLGAPCHPNGVAQFQPLGAIDEKSSASDASHHDISDAASSSSGDSFSMAGGDLDGEDDAAESPHIRQHSVLTADTTISASSQPVIASSSSQKRVVSFGGEADGSLESWMDFEPDAPADHPELGKSLVQSPVLTPIKPVRPLSRLGDRSINESPPRAKSANAAATTRRLSNPFEGYTRPTSRARSLHLDPTAAAVAAAAKEQNRHSMHSIHSLHSVDIAVPTRCSSLKHRVSFTDDARKAISTRSRSRSHASSRHRQPDHIVAPGTDRSSIISDLKEELEPWFRYLDAHDTPTSTPRQGLAPPLLVTPRPTSRSGAAGPSRAYTTPTPRPRSQAQTRSRPTSSLSTSYTWLEDPIDIPPPPSDDQSRRIPLPPNVMESLRVSVTCFPETTLLCSSLSIETIRSYSRKVRQPAAPEALRPDTPPASPKRWRWLSSRRTTNLNRRCCSRGASSSNLDLPSSASLSPSTATLVAPPQWSRIRSVFPQGSDWLCDALYAHIVAYNYLAPMVQNSTTQSQPRPPTPASPSSSSVITDDSIPKKAATLLGLQGMQGMQDMTTSPPPPKSLRKRSSMFLGLRTCSASRQSQIPTPAPPAVPTMTPAAHAAAVSDVPLRELQQGLSRCIAHLVTTLRAGGSGRSMAGGDLINEVDPLVMRSLCEIVKCCEESPSTTNDRSL
ncbi:hypothetical protein CTAM01_13641 [Colletotrichum tamarilloi]|uniref:Folliculin-interacting protein N-terminal domain-containing protein n=1 Tax=Colletotrichum tamarilloi TaxID=1209934 RepID=A0ABQ9QRM0_9PEZI|nr:uncharacterized protein CTAM01_13641 [Colletotrichum tamarilloi]KAK1482291.1 hypothetical protein CTAM01_13641 [Colletotrichum tamarilloi]